MEIHWDRMQEIDKEQREAVETRLRRLAEHHDDLLGVRIVSERNHHHRHGGHAVHIHCSVRGDDLFAMREREDLGLALHDAVRALEREIRDRRERILKLRNRPGNGKEMPTL